VSRSRGAGVDDARLRRPAARRGREDERKHGHHNENEAAGPSHVHATSLDRHLVGSVRATTLLPRDSGSAPQSKPEDAIYARAVGGMTPSGTARPMRR
jgi:hypothetical protein